ncbi:hypothetical protein ACHAXR_003332 [Thalassiosira sp. AJA248-18]
MSLDDDDDDNDCKDKKYHPKTVTDVTCTNDDDYPDLWDKPGLSARFLFTSGDECCATFYSNAPHCNVVDVCSITSSNKPAADYTTTKSGMKYLVTKEGDGAIGWGQLVKAHYTGWLDGFDSDKKFDSSRDRGQPFQFKVGAGEVIRGWDEAFATMKVGERRKIILPSWLAYGDRGAGGVIPGGATLYFDVELLEILG